MECLPEPVSGVAVFPYRTTTTPAAVMSQQKNLERCKSALGAPTARSFAPSPSKSPQARDSPKADPYARTTVSGSEQLPIRTISSQPGSRNWNMLKDEDGGIVAEPVALNPCSDPWMIVTAPVPETSTPLAG